MLEKNLEQINIIIKYVGEFAGERGSKLNLTLILHCLPRISIMASFPNKDHEFHILVKENPVWLALSKYKS